MTLRAPEIRLPDGVITFPGKGNEVTVELRTGGALWEPVDLNHLARDLPVLCRVPGQGLPGNPANPP